MKNSYNKVYEILSKMTVLGKSDYEDLIFKFGVSLVNTVIDDMIKEDSENIVKFGKYAENRTINYDDISMNPYVIYMNDIANFDNLFKKECIELAEKMKELASQMDELFLEINCVKPTTYGNKTNIISDKVAYCFDNCDDYDKLSRIRVLYDEYIENRNKLIEGNLKSVVYRAKAFVGLSFSLNELILFGNIGLVEAAEMFDSQYDMLFGSYVWFVAKNYIVKGMRKILTKTHNVPAWIINLEFSRQKAILELMQVLGREPNNRELSSYMGIDEKKLDELDVAMLEPVSIYSSIDDETKLVDCISDDYSLEGNIIKDFLSMELRDIMLECLTEKERNILAQRYGFIDDRRYTLEEIGQEYEVTGKRISQIEQRALRKLRKVCTYRGMKDYLR